MAMGSTTYEWIADRGFLGAPSWEYTVPTWVFMRQGTAASMVQRSVRVRRCGASARGDGPGRETRIWLVGGGDLVGQFQDHGLLDEVIIGMHRCS